MKYNRAAKLIKIHQNQKQRKEKQPLQDRLVHTNVVIHLNVKNANEDLCTKKHTKAICEVFTKVYPHSVVLIVRGHLMKNQILTITCKIIQIIDPPNAIYVKNLSKISRIYDLTYVFITIFENTCAMCAVSNDFISFQKPP